MFAPNLQSVRLLQSAAHHLSGITNDYDSLMDLAGDAVFVLLGEASHGTHEFYSTRTEITRRLIKEKGFQAVAVEADWPDAYRVDQYVRGVAMTPARQRPSPGSPVFRCGCGATGMSKRSSGGYATTTMAGHRTCHRSAFMGSISIA